MGNRPPSIVLFQLVLHPSLGVVKYVSGASNGCTDVLDCGLNGICVDGGCHCDVPWTGSACDTLSFKPAKDAQGYGMQLNQTTWGGGVLYDGSKYHLYVCTMTNNCPLSTWRQNSRIDHAVADEVSGPYIFHDIAVNTWSHNVVPVRLADGTFAIFHIGEGSGAPNGGKNCTNGSIVDSEDDRKVFVIDYVDDWAAHAWQKFMDFVDANGIIVSDWDMTALDRHGRAVEGPESITRDQFPVNIIITKKMQHGSTIHVASSLYGPWKPLVPNTLGHCNNPAPWIHPNGTIYIVCGVDFKRAEQISGPWTVVSSLNFIRGPAIHFEDPFLYADKRGFHIIYHAYSNEDREQCASATTSAHAFSENGYNWHISSSEPFSTRIKFEESGDAIVSTRERPYLFFDHFGKMTHLFSAVCNVTHCARDAPCVNCKYMHWDYTMVQPLDLSPPPPQVIEHTSKFGEASIAKLRSLASYTGSLAVSPAPALPSLSIAGSDCRNQQSGSCTASDMKSLSSFQGTLTITHPRES